jgi:APA family basic amino acid/polyamine antiporter
MCIRDSASTLIMGSMIGTGIFVTGSTMAQTIPRPDVFLGLWVLTAVMTVSGALCYGELAAMMPKAGGQYVYLKQIYSPLVGFLYGWTFFGVIQTGTIAAVALGFAKFLGVLVPLVTDEALLDLGIVALTPIKLAAVAIIWFLTALNFQGLAFGAFIQNVFTLTKVAALLGIILAGAWGFFVGLGNLGHFTPAAGATVSVLGLGAALSGALFSADSWNNVTFTAGETRNPQRNLPLSLLIGTGVVCLLYLGVNTVYVYVLGMEAMAAAPSNRVGASFMQALLGQTGYYLTSGLILVSTFGCLNGVILSGGRVYYAMALDRLFLPRAARLNRAQAPAFALTCQAAWASVLALVADLNTLFGYIMFPVLVFYLLTVAGVLILRRREPNALRPYRVWGYPFIPVLYLGLTALVAGLILVDAPVTSVIGLGIVATGVPVYGALARRAVIKA